MQKTWADTGAPLLTIGNTPKVAGVMFGNLLTEMTVYSETERSKEGDETVILRTTEALHLGLAIQSGSILGLHSRLLGMTIADHLECQGLLL